MRTRYSILLPLFAFILAASAQNCSASARFKFSSRSRNFSNKATPAEDGSYSLINPIESIPVLNLQTHKTVNSVHAIFVAFNEFSLCLEYSNFFSGSDNQHIVCSKKTLLFPFHTFW